MNHCRLRSPLVVIQASHDAVLREVHHTIWYMCKVAKYGDQSNFVPFIVETGGTPRGSGRPGARRCNKGSPSAASVRQQGYYMLAQIVADLAVGNG